MIKLKNNKPLKKFNWFKPAKAGKISFFKPNKVGKLKGPLFKPIKLNTINNVRSIKKKDLTYPQAKLKNPRLNPFGDVDRDGKLNMFDCKPFDKKRHGFQHEYSFSSPGKRIKTVKMPPRMFLETTYADVRRSIDEAKRRDAERGITPKYKYEFDEGGYEDYEEHFKKKEQIPKMVAKIKSQEEDLPVPFLEFDKEGLNVGHEGRHTSAAAMKAGLKYIPVTLEIPEDVELSPEYEKLEVIEEKGYPRYNKLTSEKEVEEARRETRIEPEELGTEEIIESSDMEDNEND